MRSTCAIVTTGRPLSAPRCTLTPRTCLTPALEEGDKVSAVGLLLEAGEHHLGARDVLLGVEEVDEEGVFVPLDALLDVGIRV